MPTLTVDGIEVSVENGATVLQACEAAGAEIPRFCYHERLSIAGNCRMCLVEMEKAPKPIASCAMPAGDGMVIHTKTETVKKAREGVMEFLLINHPLDCPICDQGGECDLQDQALYYGNGESRYGEPKRAVRDKNMGPLIKTEMTRCIHCMRCVRFATEVAGADELGTLGRGEGSEVMTYLEGTLDSELSGNVIDLCPVGALTNKPYAFTARSWELKKTESIDVMDAVGSNIRLDSRGNQVMRIAPRLHEGINEEWISDKTRFHYDGLAKRRIDQPWLKGTGKTAKLQSATWDKAFGAIKKALANVDADKIAAVIGDHADVESMYALKALIAGLGSDKIECRQDGMQLEADHRGAYLFNSSIGGIEHADACLLIGCDPRHEATLVNTRLRKAVRAGGLQVANLGPELDLGYPVMQLKNDFITLSQVLVGTHKFSKVLDAAERPMVVLGVGALQADAASAYLAREIAHKYGGLTDDWNGYNVLHRAASRVGAMDLGLTTAGGLDAALADDVEVVFLLGADEFDMGLLAGKFVIYIGSHGDAGAANADVVLPGAAYSEKSGTYVNMEGRVQMGEKAVFAPGDAREDWSILRALGDVLSVNMGFDSFAGLRALLYKDYPHFAEIDALPSDSDMNFGGDTSAVAQGEVSLADNAGVDGAGYYASNAIARASDILAEVIADKTAAGEATGTDG